MRKRIDFTRLTRRERDVIELLTQLDHGTNKAIAQALGVGERTVQTHLGNMYTKFDIDGRVQLAAAYWRWLEDEPGARPGR